MRGLAELVMRGPKQAMILATVFACIPMLFWVSGHHFTGGAASWYQ